MDILEVKTPAKINLFLRVLGRRADQYHNIYSWFQAVSLYDILTFENTSIPGIKLKTIGEYGDRIPVDDGNLIIRTARFIFREYRLGSGLKINLTKNIPVAAGMGGGSSDSAATIFAINQMYDLDLSVSDMKSLGAKFGSDIPFFFSGGQAEVTGRGEIIDEIKLPLDYAIVLVIPNIAISTTASYAGLKMALTGRRDDVKLPEPKGFSDLVHLIRGVGNDFEENHFQNYPVLNKIRAVLTDCGSILTRMSGSGPTVFGLFEKMPEKEDLNRLQKDDWKIYPVFPTAWPVAG
nr:4-(cytidine 5'-diphospho)-2-C-methyl-D-erythritol kinase [candidate division Zixibacteria bacterium]